MIKKGPGACTGPKTIEFLCVLKKGYGEKKAEKENLGFDPHLVTGKGQEV